MYFIPVNTALRLFHTEGWDRIKINSIPTLCMEKSESSIYWDEIHNYALGHKYTGDKNWDGIENK